MPARARRDPSAERRELERLRKMSNRQAVRLQLRVERGTIHARLNPRGARDLIDLDDFVQMHQIDRHRTAITVAVGRLDAADHARAAAVRHRRNIRAVAPFEHADQFFLIARKRDHVDRIRIVAPIRPPNVARSLAVRMPRALVRRGRANRFERRRRLDPRRAQIEIAFLRRRRDFERPQPESLGHPLGHVLLLFGSRPLVLVAPSPELPLAILGHLLILVMCEFS